MAERQFVWSGKTDMHLNGPAVREVEHVVVGLHGGNVSHGARKNEDGALVWVGENWVLAMVLDAHNSAESADRMLDLFAQWRPRLEPICNGGRPNDFRALERAIMELLTDPSTRDGFAEMRGETACLICFQRDQYVLWISIGDNSLYLLHPDLARLGQHALTARNYFEWIGESNSLALDVPCYSSGIRQLRSGTTTIALVTDGILEFGDRAFEDPRVFAKAMLAPQGLNTAIADMLWQAHDSGATDSTTILAWQIDNSQPSLMPTG